MNHNAIPRLLVFLISCASVGFGQNTAGNPAEAPTFRSRTELVTVPVVVTRGGKHVSGLKKEQFSVAEDGKTRPVASFEEITARKEPPKRMAAEPGVYTNAFVQEPGPIGLDIILLDVLNTPVMAQANARKSIIKFLARSVQTNEPTMLVLLKRDGMKVVHPFTTDTAVLVAALKKVSSSMDGEHISGADIRAEEELKGTNSIGNAIDVTREGTDLNSFLDTSEPTIRMGIAAEQKDRARMTMELMGNLARAVQGIPGRKTLMWATGDIPCTAAYGLSAMFDMAELCEQTWNALSAANIAIYPIDVGQTNNPVYSSAQYSSPTRPNYPILQNLFAQSFAAYTGGEMCSFRDDLDTCFRKAVDDSSQYYLLSYYADKTVKPGWRKIRVKVDAAHIQVHARSGYYTLGEAASDESRRKLDIAWASLSPVDYTGVSLAVRWTRSNFNNGRAKQAFELRADASALTIDSADKNHMRLNIAAVAHDKSDKIVGDVNQTVEGHLDPSSVQKILQGGLRYTNVIELPPGAYSVKFILRDALSGRMGTVTVPLTIDASATEPANQ